MKIYAEVRYEFGTNMANSHTDLTGMNLFGARKLRQVIQTYGTDLNQFLHILTTSEHCKCKSRNTIISLLTKMQ
jgi:hypothetical protein